MYRTLGYLEKAFFDSFFRPVPMKDLLYKKKISEHLGEERVGSKCTKQTKKALHSNLFVLRVGIF